MGSRLLLMASTPRRTSRIAGMVAIPVTSRTKICPTSRRQKRSNLLMTPPKLLIEQFGFKEAGEQKKNDGNGSSGPEDDSDPPRADWDAMIGNIMAGMSLHDSTRDLAASCVAKGYRDADTATLLRSLLRSSAAPRDDRWLDRYNGIAGLVHSAREKYGKGKAAARPMTCDPPCAPTRLDHFRKFHGGNGFMPGTTFASKSS